MPPGEIVAEIVYEEHEGPSSALAALVRRDPLVAHRGRRRGRRRRELPRFEAHDALGRAVDKQREVFSSQASHRPALLVENHHVGGDGVGAGRESRDGRSLLARRWSEEEAENQTTLMLAPARS
jgi:hypothetical protein